MWMLSPVWLWGGCGRCAAAPPSAGGRAAWAGYPHSVTELLCQCSFGCFCSHKHSTSVNKGGWGAWLQTNPHTHSILAAYTVEAVKTRTDWMIKLAWQHLLSNPFWQNEQPCPVPYSGGLQLIQRLAALPVRALPSGLSFCSICNSWSDHGLKGAVLSERRRLLLSDSYLQEREEGDKLENEVQM